MNALIAVAHPRLGDRLDAGLEVGLSAAAAFVVVARSLRPDGAAGLPYTDLPCAPKLVDELPPAIGGGADAVLEDHLRGKRGRGVSTVL